jgi:hypothetical protein
METISESIRTDVPARFAGRVWDEFVYRSQSDGRPRSPRDSRWWIDESRVEKGTVTFSRADDQRVTVTVELQYRPGEGGADPATIRARLRHDLESYRAFLDDRCAATDCRAELHRAA